MGSNVISVSPHEIILCIYECVKVFTSTSTVLQLINLTQTSHYLTPDQRLSLQQLWHRAMN